MGSTLHLVIIICLLVVMTLGFTKHSPGESLKLRAPYLVGARLAVSSSNPQPVAAVDEMGTEYNLGDWTARSFNMDLYNLAMEDPAKAEDAVEVLRELATCNTHNVSEPNSATYSIVVDGYLQAGDVEQAELVMWKNIKTFQLASDASQTYMSILHAWANYNLEDDHTGYGARRGELLLRRLIDFIPLTSSSSSSTREPAKQEDGQPRDQRNDRILFVKLWTIAIEAWSKRVSVCSSALSNAERLLNEMSSDAVPVEPNVLTYTSYIVGLAKSRRPNAARTATMILDTKLGESKADMVAYTAVLNCWAKTVNRVERRQAADQAMALLDRLEQNCQPNAITYATAIAAIGNTINNNKAADLAGSILTRMQRHNVRPVTETYNTLLHTMGQLPGNESRARALLARLLDSSSDTSTAATTPNVRTWAAVLRACRSQAPVADAVLRQMEDLHRQGRAPPPNTVCYTTVMGAWGKSSTPNAISKMKAMLETMERVYDETQSPDVRPNVITYLTVIDALVRRNENGDAAEQVTAIVNRMRVLHESGKGYPAPNRAVFNALMQAWSLTESPDAPRRVEQIFQWMEKKYQQEGDLTMRPDETSLCATLNAWANNAQGGGAGRALSIWRHSESLSDEVRGFQPTVAMPNIVIKALARSDDPDSVVKAEKILLELEAAFRGGKLNLRPDVRTFSSVINACAYCSGGAEKRREALEIALRTFRKMKSAAAPNTVTYGTLLKAVNNLMPVSAEREQLVTSLFQRCCKEGYVGTFVLTQLRQVAPQIYRELAAKRGTHEVLVGHLPQSWTKSQFD